MRNKIIAIILLLVSIFLVITSLTSLKSYNLIKSGNNFIVNEKYQEGREMYEKALTIEKNNGIKLNILKSFYQEKNYEEVVKSEVEDGFLKGNSYTYLGDKAQDKNKEFYEKALEEYKLAMKKSKDINIKKNYEIVLKKLEDIKNQQNQQNQEEKQKDENQNKQNNKENNNSDKDNQQNNDSKNNDQNKSKDNKENSSSENKQDKSQNNEKDSEKNNENNKNNNSEQNQNNSSDDDNGEEKQNNNSDTEKKENEENSTPSKDIKEASQDEIREQEVKAILKRLEGNEKQSFKNNERVMNINNNNPSNRW